MKRYFILVVLLVALAYTGMAQSIYDIGLNDIQGRSFSLTTFKGKKMMFIVLPVKEKDSAKMKELSNFILQNTGKIFVIGIPAAYETVTAKQEKEIEPMYRRKQVPPFIMTQSAQVGKSAGGNQYPLMKWLTDKELNKHFNQDIKGEWQTFFVDETGMLYAVMGPEIPLTAKTITNIINRPPAQ
jgi:glutathione peroxidase